MFRPLNFLAAVGLAALTCACGSIRAGSQVDKLEALARWGMANAETDLDPPAAYCLATADTSYTDPSAALLARFESTRVPVVPLSRCEREEDFRRSTRHAFIDPVTGNYGIAIFVALQDSTEDVNETGSVLVVQGGLWGAGYLCQLDQGADGKWTVTSCERTLDI